jgi:hypothetical protein
LSQTPRHQPVTPVARVCAAGVSLFAQQTLSPADADAAVTGR